MTTCQKKRLHSGFDLSIGFFFNTLTSKFSSILFGCLHKKAMIIHEVHKTSFSKSTFLEVKETQVREFEVTQLYLKYSGYSTKYYLSTQK